MNSINQKADNLTRALLKDCRETPPKGMDLKIMDIKKSSVNNPDGSVRITRTPKVTGKGQIYFVNKFLKGELN